MPHGAGRAFRVAGEWLGRSGIFRYTVDNCNAIRFFHRDETSVLGGVLLACVGVGCTTSAPSTAIDPGDPTARAAEARAELSAIGAGFFTVQDFRPTSEVKLVLPDDFDYPSRMVALNFQASVSCTQQLDVPTILEAMKLELRPEVTIAEIDRDVALESLFGAGAVLAGEQRAITASAIFDALEPGYRFRVFDHPRAPQP